MIVYRINKPFRWKQQEDFNFYKDQNVIIYSKNVINNHFEELYIILKREIYFVLLWKNNHLSAKDYILC